MPRCQRTFRYLRSGTISPGEGISRWTCSQCTEREVYSVLREADLLAYAALAESACVTDFGRPGDYRRPYLLLWGIRPECVYEPEDRRYDIYLAAGSDPWQARLQIGHELFHRVGGEGKVFHWTHEMFACLVSVRQLQRNGFGEYTARAEQQYAVEAESCSLSRLLGADPWAEAVYPPGYYGRAFVTGMALKEIVGWSALCRLAHTRSEATGVPDVSRWISSLKDAERGAVKSLLIGSESPQLQSCRMNAASPSEATFFPNR